MVRNLRFFALSVRLRIWELGLAPAEAQSIGFGVPVWLVFHIRSGVPTSKITLVPGPPKQKLCIPNILRSLDAIIPRIQAREICFLWRNVFLYFPGTCSHGTPHCRYGVGRWKDLWGKIAYSEISGRLIGAVSVCRMKFSNVLYLGIVGQDAF